MLLIFNILILHIMTLSITQVSITYLDIIYRNIKPFYSIEDFQIRGKVNQTTVEKLRSMNVLDGMPESSQLSLF